MTTSERDILEAIAGGLSDRARGLLRALDRQDRLETAQAFVGWLGTERDAGRLAETTRELLLRALRVGSEPQNLRILEALDPLEAAEIPDLMAVTGLGRVAVSERVNDLVQTGLAVRELLGDQVRRTSLADGLLGLVAEASEKASQRLREDLEPAGAAVPGPEAPGD